MHKYTQRVFTQASRNGVTVTITTIRERIRKHAANSVFPLRYASGSPSTGRSSPRTISPSCDRTTTNPLNPAALSRFS